MLSKELQLLKADPISRARFLEGLEKLYQSNVLYFIRSLGRVDIDTKNASLEAVAINGAHAAGWQDCLDMLMNFDELVFKDRTVNSLPPSRYGGLQLAVTRGDITQDEADGIRAPNRNVPSANFTRADAANARTIAKSPTRSN